MDPAAAQAAVRFGYGPRPDDPFTPDPRAALKAQLLGPDPGLASGQFEALPSGQDAVDTQRADALVLRSMLTAPEAQRKAYRSLAAQQYRQDAAAQMGWAVQTPCGFRERLVWFWANHFSVSAAQNQAGPLIGPMIREAIRPHVTGKFADMVLAVERHPAMLRYLDNNASIGPDSPAGLRSGRGLNENLGRECMELHTVGLGAKYSQADVTNMAKILTGWGAATSEQGSDATGFMFHPNQHEPGPQVVLGRRFDGGEQAGVDALTFLATYPTTYRFLATKLVTHFVADQPPAAAAKHIAGVLHDTGGDLGAASAALVDLPQAWVPGQKLKTPFDFVVSALRGAPPPAGSPPVNLLGVLNGLGQPVWNAPLPNGWPDQAAAWSGSDAIMSRIDWAYTYAARLDAGAGGVQPADIAQNAMGPLLRPATMDAIAKAGSRREAITLFLTAPEFQRR
jgi:uncharacterized protein (DUF1800 family)